jgi:uncharacterized protein
MTTSRFTYHTDTDDPGEGGVREVPAERAGRPDGRPVRVSDNGVPGPEAVLLDVSELIRTVGMRYTHRFALPVGSVAELDAVEPIVGEVTLTNSGDALILRGESRTALQMECARCLRPTVQPVETELEEEFDLVTGHNAFHQEEVKAVDENTTATVIDGSILSLGELLRQSLLLAAPLQPICPDGCPPAIEEALSTGAAVDADIDSTNPALRELGRLWAQRAEGTDV